MNNLLYSLKLKADHTLELPLSKSEFLTKLSNNITPGGVGTFDGLFDVFSKSKHDYRGEITMNGFQLKRKRKFFDRNKMMVVTTGNIVQKDGKIVIQMEVNGFNKLMIPAIVLILLFYILFLGIFSFGIASSEQTSSFIMLPFILIHAALMFFIPLFMIRKSVQNMIKDLDKDFRLMTLT